MVLGSSKSERAPCPLPCALPPAPCPLAPGPARPPAAPTSQLPQRSRPARPAPAPPYLAFQALETAPGRFETMGFIQRNACTSTALNVIARTRIKPSNILNHCLGTAKTLTAAVGAFIVPHKFIKSCSRCKCRMSPCPARGCRRLR